MKSFWRGFTFPQPIDPGPIRMAGSHVKLAGLDLLHPLSKLPLPPQAHDISYVEPVTRFHENHCKAPFALPGERVCSTVEP